MKALRTNIYKRKYRNGRVAWVVRYYDDKSRTWRAFKGGNTKTEALAVEGKVRHQLLREEDPSFLRKTQGEALKISVLIAEYLKSPGFNVKKPKWRHEALLKFNKDVLPYFGDLNIQGLSGQRIMSYYLGLKERGLSNRTIHKHHILLCHLGDFYESLDSSGQNPFRQLKRFKKEFPQNEASRDINFLIPEELSALIKEVDQSESELLSPFVRFLIATGMRRSEAYNLKWRDIDRSSGFIQIRTSKTGKGRVIPWDLSIEEALSTLDSRTEYVFTNSEGRRPHQDSFLKPLARAAKRAGITKRIDLHTLRHSYASNLLRRGVPLVKVSALLGHSDISMTANVYGHLLDGDLKVKAELSVENLIVPAKSEKVWGEMRTELVQEISTAIAEKLIGNEAGESAIATVFQILSAKKESPVSLNSAETNSSSEVLPNLKVSGSATQMLRLFSLDGG